ncbi:hypothetical protein PSP6_490119 [Paraburkholderia tropica]|nr:hypothetical protein PSP6_490119 [Paraburkholderia tropica]
MRIRLSESTLTRVWPRAIEALPQQAVATQRYRSVQTPIDPAACQGNESDNRGDNSANRSIHRHRAQCAVWRRCGGIGTGFDARRESC